MREVNSRRILDPEYSGKAIQWSAGAAAASLLVSRQHDGWPRLCESGEMNEIHLAPPNGHAGMSPRST